MEAGCLVLFTKPAIAGRVKTRLIGHLSAERAAALHEAMLSDCRAALAAGNFAFWIAWALDAGEALPGGPETMLRQSEGDLGGRLFAALAAAAETHGRVAAAGSDRPGLDAAAVERALARLDRADVVVEPALDGGYSLLAVRSTALRREIFDGIPWSTSEVLPATLARLGECRLECELLAPAGDLDTPADLTRLCERLAAGEPAAGPRTRRLLGEWGLVGSLAPA